MFLQIVETAKVLEKVQDQSMSMYFLVIAVVALSTVVVILWRKLEARTEKVITLYSDNAAQDKEFGTHLKEISEAIRKNDAAAAKELIARLEAERRFNK